MLVELGSTMNIHRAHIVRGILGTYGIEAAVWHENALHIYCPGWNPRAVLMVSEDDEDDARELMKAPLEPQQDSTDASTEDAKHQLLPGFEVLLITGLGLCFTCAVLEFLLSIVGKMPERGRYRNGPMITETLQLTPAWIMVGGLAWGLLAFLAFIPVHDIRNRRWMALISYLWIRALLTGLPIAIGLSLR